MTPELLVLGISAATIALVHTLLGPDHYLPFVALARARQWSLRKTLRITLYCGAGHLIGSIVLGLLGILLGIHLASLEWLESVRGNLAAWLLIGFGLAYCAWGLRQGWRNRPHNHWHHHNGFSHRHEHNHHDEHAHVHESRDQKRSLAPWLIFVVFVLGPCEPLIPLLMYPAARESLVGVVMVTSVFGVVTVLTMLGAVALTMRGLKAARLGRFQRFGHAVAGGAIFVCGLAVVLLGV